MRKITYSAGLVGDTPIRQIMRPLSRSFCVIVVRSHRTKYASSGLSPSSAPSRHNTSRKSSTLCRMLSQSRSLLGSKTAHCVLRSIECSI